jgi:tetratricopeptide (TPR) repeat protein
MSCLPLALFLTRNFLPSPAKPSVCMRTRRVVHTGLLLGGVFAALIVSIPSRALADGDTHLLIEETTREIETAPTAKLLVKRGSLYSRHGSYNEALADFDRAEKLDASVVEVYYWRAEALFSSLQPDQAQAAIDKFIKHAPVDHTLHRAAHELRARILGERGAYLESAREYDYIVSLPHGADVGLFSARAEVLVSAGEYDKALASLDEGNARFGGITALHLSAIEIEKRIRRYSAALARVDRLMASAPRKESWWVRRAEILTEMGRPAEAADAYRQAQLSIEKLSPQLRNNKFIRDLEEKIRRSIHTPNLQ